MLQCYLLYRVTISTFRHILSRRDHENALPPISFIPLFDDAKIKIHPTLHLLSENVDTSEITTMAMLGSNMNYNVAYARAWSLMPVEYHVWAHILQDLHNKIIINCHILTNRGLHCSDWPSLVLTYRKLLHKLDRRTFLHIHHFSIIH